MKTTDTTIALNRMAAALAKHDVKLRRMQLLEVTAAALGYRNGHEMAAADTDGELTPPAAERIGTRHVEGVGPMTLLRDPDGVVFAVETARLDGVHGQAAKWILSPFGGVLEIGEAAEADHDGRQAPTLVMWDGDALFHPVLGDGAMPIDPERPAYMTNGCCEAASVTAKDLDRLGLAYGSFDGEFYPLTEREGGYIAEDEVRADDGLHEALIAYSVLYRGAKHLMPTIEMANGPEDGFPPRDQVLREAMSYAQRILPKIEEMGGTVLVDTQEGDRVGIQLLIPLEAAMEVGDFDAWRAHVAWLMVDPDLPSVLRREVVHAGKRYRASVGWIGEGVENDYDPDAPGDRPLLRFDVDELIDGKWTEVRDGSYCTGISAFCTAEQALALARMVVETLENGGSPKRQLELLSWTSSDEIGTHAKTTDAEPGDFVAHETYGSPDEGTSIDLRRRADGSVRCEVYADLDCVALNDARGGMPEVRQWLQTLPGDVENADGANAPARALAPQYVEGRVRWLLVPAHETEAEWFADVPADAPFEHRFVSFDEMTV